MKRKIILIMLMCSLFIISSLIGILFIKDIKGNEINSLMDFKKNLYYNSTDLPYDNPFNVRNYSRYTGHYNTTYSFENDIIGSIPIDWSGNNLGGVINEFENHNKVLLLIGNNVDYSSFYTSITRINGIIEFWFAVNNSVKEFSFLIKDTTEIIIYFTIDSNQLKIMYGSTFKGISININQWYHIKIEFDCVSDKQSYWINNILELDNQNFYLSKNADSLTMIDLVCALDVERVYFDSIGYSWESTYDFNNDIVNNEPLNWNIENDNDCTTKIKDFLDNNINILELYDNNDEGISSIFKVINQKINQTLSFYLAKSNIENENHGYIELIENDSVIIQLYLKENDLYHNDPVPILIKENFIIVNEFFRITIVFDDFNNIFDCYVNGILEGNDLNYKSNSTISVNKIKLKTRLISYDYSFFIDDIIISSDKPYTIGQNLIPYIEINPNIKEVDRYEFAYKNTNDLYEIGYDNPSGWNEIEFGGSDYINVAIDINDNNDRTIKMTHDTYYEDNTGIYNEFNIIKGMLNISWSIRFTYWDIINNFTTKIYSYDDSLIFHIILEGGKLKYYNSTDIIILDNGLEINQIYEFNLCINPYSNSTLRYSENSIYQDTFLLPCYTLGKEGLSKIEFLIQPKINYVMIGYLDYVGIYVNYAPLTTELGIIGNKNMINFPIFRFHTYNLFFIDFINIIGNISLYIGSYPNIIQSTQICSFDIYNTSKVFNLYDKYHNEIYSYIEHPILWVCFYNQVQLLKWEISIEGCTLDYIDRFENEQTVSLGYTHNGINVDESYFYIDSNSRLAFKYNVNQDDILEYIQCQFIIYPEIPSTERSLYFTTHFYGKLDMYYEIKYFDFTTETITISHGYFYIHHSLKPDNALFSITFLITDNNDNNKYGISTGFITDINFKYMAYFPVDVLTQNLMVIIIPLIIILIPTLAIGFRYGKDSIIPTLILMSIICFVSDLIPIWLFFIIMLCLGSCLFIRYREKVI